MIRNFDMLGKIFHFLTLFAYLNLLTYESFSSATGQVLHAGETIVEYFLDDVLDLEPIQSSQEEKVLLQDDYRIFSLNSQVLPIFILFLGSSLQHYVLQRTMNILFIDLKPCACRDTTGSYPVFDPSSYAP